MVVVVVSGSYKTYIVIKFMPGLLFKFLILLIKSTVQFFLN